MTLAREKTRPVQVGSVTVGGTAPVSVQTMCTTKTSNASATLEQIAQVKEAGAEIIRVTLPSASDVSSFARICEKSPLPVVADIHFDYRLALEAAAAGAAALRINPGNIGSFEKVNAILHEAALAHIPIRIGVNAGSLEPSLMKDETLTLTQKMVFSAKHYVEHCYEQGFYDVVVSAKAHSVPTTIEVYEQLSKELPQVPLHMGVTEAGTLRQGTVKNSVGVGYLLLKGIGNTIRLSLTADPTEECKVAWDLLSACGVRRLHPELVSCPTCGRTNINVMQLANEIQEKLDTIQGDLTVAVMGCAVNGPGEARDADIGIACGKEKAVLFSKGEKIKTISATDIMDELMREIKARLDAQVK